MPKIKRKTTTKKRKVIYPKIGARIYSGDESLTAAQAKTMLGWDTKNVDEKTALFKDLEGNYVRCWHNCNNRPFEIGLARAWMSEILKRYWMLNGQTLILGRTGITLSAQHRLVALVWAVQKWSAEPEQYPAWKTEPTLECIVVFGISEDDDTVNTIDTGKSRSLSDVIFRSGLFSQVKTVRDRKQISRMLNYAVKMLWHRTGAAGRMMSPKRSHADSLDFVKFHPRILEAVSQVYSLNRGDGKDRNRIGKYRINPGFASALLYLMSSGHTDPAEYRKTDYPSEMLMDFGLWDRAVEFWKSFATQGKPLNALRKALGEIADEGSLRERCALVLKAWQAFVEEKPVTPKTIKLNYHLDDDEIRHLAEFPTAGGIDQGDKRASEEAEEEIQEITEEEIEERATVVRQSRTKKKVVRKKKKTQAKFEVDDKVWVHDEDGGHWYGTVSELYDDLSKVTVAKGFAGAGKSFEVPLNSLRVDQPA